MDPYILKLYGLQLLIILTTFKYLFLPEQKRTYLFQINISGHSLVAYEKSCTNCNSWVKLSYPHKFISYTLQMHEKSRNLCENRSLSLLSNFVRDEWHSK